MQKFRYKIFLFFLLVETFSSLRSQTNLVPNPSFESYASCPNTTDQINLANSWSSFRVTPDYFNSCSPQGLLSVPFNVLGYQNAYSGNAFAGFVAFDVGGFAREIIGSQLTQTLIVGVKYYVSLRFSLAEFDAINKQYIPCNKVGVRFSTIQYSSVTPAPINNFAHIYINTIISDTMNWTTVSGSFIADSNYKFIMIGNFFDDANTDTIYRPNGVDSYFFTDDICVSTSSLTCPQSTEMQDVYSFEGFNLFPIPATSFLHVDFLKPQQCEIIIQNTLGSIVYHETKNHSLLIDVSNFASGLYVVSVITKDKIYAKKVIINKNLIE